MSDRYPRDETSEKLACEPRSVQVSKSAIWLQGCLPLADLASDFAGSLVHAEACLNGGGRRGGQQRERQQFRQRRHEEEVVGKKEKDLISLRLTQVSIRHSSISRLS